jgi:hypothetical protein
MTSYKEECSQAKQNNSCIMFQLLALCFAAMAEVNKELRTKENNS